MIKWPKIKSFADVVRFAKVTNRHDKIMFKSKIKLDGTNAAVCKSLFAGVISYQSREREISPQDDNFGFAGWAIRKYQWPLIDSSEDVTVFGEWIGPGIVSSKQVATSKLPDRKFIVFGVRIGSDESGRWIFDPQEIRQFANSDVEIIPWTEYEIEIDFGSEASIKSAVSKLNEWVAAVEPECPYMKQFGVSGIGEGLVFYPEDVQDVENFMFKAKGEKHRVTSSEAPAQASIQKLESINKFVDYFCTEQRFTQGLEKLGGEKNKSLTGKFVQWVSDDVKSESTNELEENGLTWQQVKSDIEKTARKWWLGL